MGTADGHENVGCPVLRVIEPVSARFVKSSKHRPSLAFSVLTLYAFSVENWKRPHTEVSTLMQLLKEYLNKELENIHKNNIRFRTLGRTDQLDASVRRELDKGIARTRDNTGMIFNVALNYGGRAEIVDAVNQILRNGGPAPPRTAALPKRSSHNTCTRPDCRIQIY